MYIMLFIIFKLLYVYYIFKTTNWIILRVEYEFLFFRKTIYFLIQSKQSLNINR